MPVEVKKRLYTIDDIANLPTRVGNRDVSYELHDGELIEMSPANELHSWLAAELARLIGNYARERNLGYAFVEGGYYPEGDRHNLYGPDVAFVRRERLSFPLRQTFSGFMPDLAVEIKSPSNTRREMRDKAAFYLANGAKLVWIVLPGDETAEIWRLGADGALSSENIASDGQLDGEDVLPSFTLDLRRLFTP